MNKEQLTTKLIEELLNDDSFFVISMLTYDGRRLYLKSDGGYNREWTFDRNQAIWFSTYDDAESFAKKWFKNFKSWEIIECG